MLPIIANASRRVALVALLCATARSMSAQQIPPQFHAAADSFAKLVATGVVQSIAVSVTTRTGVVWETAFGFSNREENVRATATTAYPVASVAKSLTAIGALRAVDRRLLDLDRPVNSYLGALAIRVPIGNAADLTTRTLLHMTGGIPHVVRFHWPDEPRSSALDAPLGHFAAFAPGTQFHYSNESLGIVGEILARVSGKPFTRYMTEDVFRPLGMTSTAVRGADISARVRARTYTGKPLHVVGFTRLDPEPGAGMYTSAHDLATLAREIFLAPKPALLSTKQRDELFDFYDFPYYSAGWWRDPTRDRGLTLLADGAALGHSATLKVLPREGVAVAVLVNSGVDDGFTLFLCDFVLRTSGLAPAVKGRAEMPPEFVDHPITGDTTWAGKWTGVVVAGRDSVPVTVAMDSSGFHGVVGAGLPLQSSHATQANGVLESNIAGALPSDAVAGQSHTLGIKLRRSDTVLTGYVTASAQLGDRPFFVLPYYVELRRAR